MRKDGCILIPQPDGFVRSGHHMREHVCVVCGFIDMLAKDGHFYFPESRLLLATEAYVGNFTSTMPQYAWNTYTSTSYNTSGGLK